MPETTTQWAVRYECPSVGVVQYEVPDEAGARRLARVVPGVQVLSREVTEWRPATPSLTEERAQPWTR